MATGYGAWIGTDDWRAVVEATVSYGSDKSKATVTVVCKVESLYGSDYGTTTGTTRCGSDSGSTSGLSINPGTTTTLRTQAFTVSRGASDKTVSCQGVVRCDNSTYGGATSTASVNVTVLANAYTITYNANSGSGAPAASTKQHGVAFTISSTKPTRTGYDFSQWHAVGSSHDAWYASGGTIPANVNEDLTLFAAWTAKTYTVSYNANGGSGAPSAQTKTYGQTLTLSSTKPTRTGHTFKGWATSSTSSTVAYSAGGSYTANAAATLYAVWQANTYAVSYNANGGSGAPSSQTKTYGVTLKLSTTKPTRTGYRFDGWATSSSGSVAYAAGANYTANAAVTLYAHWTQMFTISYAANGGSSTPSSQTKYAGTDLTLRGAISRADAETTYRVTFNANGGSVSPSYRDADKTTGYTFSKWKASTNGALYEAGDIYRANAAATMTAQWTSSTSTDSVTLPTPTRTNYRFAGWYTASSGGTRVGDGGGSYTPTSNVTLYAHWTLAYTAPKLTSISVVRCDSTGDTEADDDDLTYCNVTAKWTNGSENLTGLTITIGGSTTSVAGPSGTTYTTRLSGVATSTRYPVSISITDGTTTSTKSTVLSPVFSTLEFLAGGRGIAIGMAAKAVGFFVNMVTTLYGNLNVDGNTLQRGTSVADTTADNGVYVRDKAGAWIGRFVPYFNTGNREGIALSSRATVGNASVYNTIYLYVNAQTGERTVVVSDAEAWRNGIGASSGVWPIAAGGTGTSAFGTVVQNDITTAYSLANATSKSIGSITLTEGTWLIHFGAVFDANSTGRRSATLGTTADSTSTAFRRYGAGETANAVNGAATVLNGGFIRTIGASGDKTFYLTLYQNSGAALDVTGCIQAMRIK